MELKVDKKEVRKRRLNLVTSLFNLGLKSFGANLRYPLEPSLSFFFYASMNLIYASEKRGGKG